MALLKILFALDTDMIAPNINLNELNDEIRAFKNKKLEVSTLKQLLSRDFNVERMFCMGDPVKIVVKTVMEIRWEGAREFKHIYSRTRGSRVELRRRAKGK